MSVFLQDGNHRTLTLQVMWSTTQPLPEKETAWEKAPWCWQWILKSIGRFNKNTFLRSIKFRSAYIFSILKYYRESDFSYTSLEISLYGTASPFLCWPTTGQASVKLSSQKDNSQNIKSLLYDKTIPSAFSSDIVYKNIINGLDLSFGCTQAIQKNYASETV